MRTYANFYNNSKLYLKLIIYKCKILNLVMVALRILFHIPPANCTHTLMDNPQSLPCTYITYNQVWRCDVTPPPPPEWPAHVCVCTYEQDAVSKLHRACMCVHNDDSSNGQITAPS